MLESLIQISLTLATLFGWRGLVALASLAVLAVVLGITYLLLRWLLLSDSYSLIHIVADAVSHSIGSLF